MGFKQRQKKRMTKAAQARAQRQGRENGTASRRHWLTPVSTKTCCAQCGGILATGRDMVYRHTPREALCLPCAEGAGLVYVPSVRWENAHRGRKAA